MELGHTVSPLHFYKRTRSPVAVQEPWDGRDADRGGTGKSNLLLWSRWNYEDEDPPQPFQCCEQQPQQLQERCQILHIDGEIWHLICSDEECEAHLMIKQNSQLYCGKCRHNWEGGCNGLILGNDDISEHL